MPERQRPQQSASEAGAERFVREVERVADRLRVVGPRMAARSSPEAAQLLDRVRALLQHVADLSADAEGVPRRAVPVLAAHALADQLLVLGHELARHGDDGALEAAGTALAELKRDL